MMWTSGENALGLVRLARVSYWGGQAEYEDRLSGRCAERAAAWGYLKRLSVRFDQNCPQR